MMLQGVYEELFIWERHANAEEPLLACYREALKEDRDTPAKVKDKYRGASIVGGNQVVFNIKGNSYPARIVGTHAEHNAMDVEGV